MGKLDEVREGQRQTPGRELASLSLSLPLSFAPLNTLKMSGAGGFFDEDDEDEVLGDVTTSADHNDSFFSETTSPSRAYARAPAAGRMSSVSGYRDRTTSSARASSTFSEDRSRDYRPRRDESPSLEDIIGRDEVFATKERNIVTLIRHWANEIAAPELLVFPRDLVERIVKDLARRVRPKRVHGHGYPRRDADSFIVLVRYRGKI